MNCKLWNIIHDGSIEAVTGRVPGDVVLTIGIAYICDHLSTTAKTLHVTLRNCSHFSYAPHGETPIGELAEIAILELEVLSAVQKPQHISVCCVGGTLDVAYECVEVRTVKGVPVEQAELESAANKSVAAWLASKRGR